ncbi:hypothetical protein PI125_g19802 [Phytophthora idaei]|nr:hypothetical protein PI125_g19802 [Phytophthora idaei]
MTHYSTVSKTSDVCADNKREDLFPQPRMQEVEWVLPRVHSVLDLWAAQFSGRGDDLV